MFEKLNLNRLDIFGVQPKLFIDDKLKFQTKFGSFLSFLLLGIIIVASWIYGNDLYYKNNPNSIFTEGSTNHPEKYKLEKDTLNFCFGLQDEFYNHFIDPQIYTVDLELNTILTKKDENGKPVNDFHTKKLDVRQCKKSDFGIAEDYFHNLGWLDKLFCLDNYDDAVFEGDFGSPIFTDIEAKFYPCQNTTENNNHCKPQEEIDKALNDNYYAIYVSDYVVNPKNYNKPFEPVGRNSYGVSSSKMFKHVDFFFRNIYIEDNTGVVFDTWSSQRGIQFSDQKELIKLQQQDSGKFLQLLFRLEKVKYTRIYRTYLNLAQVLANVGGIMKVAMLVLLIIATYVGDTYYHINMVNSLFNFGYDINQKSTKNQKKAHNDKQLYMGSLLDIFFGRCRKQQIQQQQKLLDYSIQKLGYHLNIKNILHKLMEVDKLKRLLLDQDQIQIFEYLPKPMIDDDVLEDQNTKIQPSVKQKNNDEQPKSLKDIKEIQNKNDSKAKVKEFNILEEDKRSSKQKEQDAYMAYQNIFLRKKRRKIDQKLLKIMDINLLKKFSVRLSTRVDIPINVIQEFQQESDTTDLEQSKNSNIFQSNINRKSQQHLSIVQQQQEFNRKSQETLSPDRSATRSPKKFQSMIDNNNLNQSSNPLTDIFEQSLYDYHVNHEYQESPMVNKQDKQELRINVKDFQQQQQQCDQSLVSPQQPLKLSSNINTLRGQQYSQGNTLQNQSSQQQQLQNSFLSVDSTDNNIINTSSQNQDNLKQRVKFQKQQLKYKKKKNYKQKYQSQQNQKQI